MRESLARRLLSVPMSETRSILRHLKDTTAVMTFLCVSKLSLDSISDYTTAAVTNSTMLAKLIDVAPSSSRSNDINSSP